MTNILVVIVILCFSLFSFAEALAGTPVFGGGGAGWVSQTDCSTVVAEGAGCWDTDDDIFYVGDGTTAQAIGPGTAGSVAFGNVLSGTNISEALVVGTGASLDFGGSGIINASKYKGTSSVTENEFGYLSGVTSVIQTQLDGKANLVGATFTGTVTFPDFVLGATAITVSGTEINSLYGVTSNVQTQLDGKADISHNQAESTITFTDITTGNASASAHGYLKKLSGVGSQFLNGLGNWVSGLVGSDAIWDAKGDLVAATGADTAQKLTAGSNGSVLTTDSGETTGLKWIAKGANNSVFGVNDSGTLGFFTTMYLDVPWAVGTESAPTAEGQAYWNSSSDSLTVGTGSGYVTLLSTGGTLAVDQGGTGKSSWTQYAIPYASASTTISEIQIGTAGQYLKVNSTADGYEFGTVAGGGDVMGPATHAANYIPKWNGTPNSKTLVEGVVAPSSALAGVSDTQTFTNKSYDAEAAGNILTIPVKIWLAAAGCNDDAEATFWDLPTTNPAVPACVTGTNIQKGVLDFADGANALSAQTNLMLPSDFSASGNLDVVIKWFSSTTSGDVVWQVDTVCVADGETDDPSWNTASTVTDTTKGTANQLNDASITNVIKTGCAAGELMHLGIYRDPTHASDTMAGTARLIGVEATYRRAM